MQSMAFYWPIHYAVVLLSGFDAGRAQRTKLFANPIKEPFSFDNAFESVVLPRYMSQLRDEITRYCDGCVFGNRDWEGETKCVARGSATSFTMYFLIRLRYRQTKIMNRTH